MAACSRQPADTDERSGGRDETLGPVARDPFRASRDQGVRRNRAAPRRRPVDLPALDRLLETIPNCFPLGDPNGMGGGGPRQPSPTLLHTNSICHARLDRHTPAPIWHRAPPRGMPRLTGAISSVGRALRLHRRCRRFEPVIAHQTLRSSAKRKKLMGWTPPDGIYVPKWRC